MAANLASMWTNFEAAGARCLVVSGIIVTVKERERFENAIPGAQLMLCRLRAKPNTLAARIMRRGEIEGAGSDGAATGLTVEGLHAYAERAAAFAAHLDAEDIADISVDTDDVPVPEVADRVLTLIPGWPHQGAWTQRRAGR